MPQSLEKTFRVSADGPLQGPENMARDIALLEQAESGTPGARVYSWQGPWISLGRSQDPQRDLLDPHLVPWVMRPTGGKAVLHGHDATLGLALPLDLIGVTGRSVVAAYRAIVGPLVEALNDCGLNCRLAEQTPFAGKGTKTVDCFAHVSPNDIVDPRTGAKVCGCALRLTDRALLLQASIPNGPPLVDPQRLFAVPQSAIAQPWAAERLADSLAHRLAEHFGG